MPAMGRSFQQEWQQAGKESKLPFSKSFMQAAREGVAQIIDVFSHLKDLDYKWIFWFQIIYVRKKSFRDVPSHLGYQLISAESS